MNVTTYYIFVYLCCCITVTNICEIFHIPNVKCEKTLIVFTFNILGIAK